MMAAFNTCDVQNLSQHWHFSDADDNLLNWKSVWNHQVVSILLFTKVNARFLNIYH